MLRLNKILRFSSSLAPSSSSRKHIIRGAGLAVLASCGLFASIEYQKRNMPIAVAKTEIIGKPKLGGEWSLIESKTGKPFTDKDLHGKWSLLYFGFTYCPDVCPQEMEKAVKVLEILKKSQNKSVPEIQPIFITVDPRRDTCSQLNSYLKNYPANYIALTGSSEAIKKMSKLYRVFYNENIKSTSEGEDYLVDHSIIHYLINDRGEFVEFFGRNLSAEEIASKIIELSNSKK
jgi:cytochrome oxidase Cu insertion factor (SCO1/SenC/PrrC family)